MVLAYRIRSYGVGGSGSHSIVVKDGQRTIMSSGNLIGQGNTTGLNYPFASFLVFPGGGVAMSQHWLGSVQANYYYSLAVYG